MGGCPSRTPGAFVSQTLVPCRRPPRRPQCASSPRFRLVRSHRGGELQKRDLLIRQHGREGFSIEHPAQRVGFHRELWSRPLAIQRGIAIIAVLAAAAGVTIVMLLWVSARRREIGIRIAVGASKRDIVMQVMTETSVASAVAGCSAHLAVVWPGRRLQP